MGIKARNEHRRYVVFRLKPLRPIHENGSIFRFSGFEKLKGNLPLDEAQSLYQKWFREAASSDDPENRFNVGMRYSHNINPPSTDHWLIRFWFRYVASFFSKRLRNRRCFRHDGKPKQAYKTKQEALDAQIEFQPVLRNDTTSKVPYPCKKHGWHVGAGLSQRYKNSLKWRYIKTGR